MSTILTPVSPCEIVPVKDAKDAQHAYYCKTHYWYEESPEDECPGPMTIERVRNVLLMYLSNPHAQPLKRGHSDGLCRACLEIYEEGNRAIKFLNKLEDG